MQRKPLEDGGPSLDYAPQWPRPSLDDAPSEPVSGVSIDQGPSLDDALPEPVSSVTELRLQSFCPCVSQIHHALLI